MTARLVVENLQVDGPDGPLVEPLSFHIAAGGVLCVLGETGAGKSLLAQAILGALPAGLAASGAVHLDGQRIDRLPPRSRARLWGRSLALLPQEPWRALDPTMQARPQVAEVYRLVGVCGPGESRARADQAFAALGLTGAERKVPAALSGGMAQRVAFAAATAGGAMVVMADEPTKGLDAALRDRVTALLRRVAETGGALLVVTHDVGVARALGGQTLVLRHGRIVEAGPSNTVLAAPRSNYARALIAADPGLWPAAVAPAAGNAVLTAEDLGVARGGHVLFQGLGFSVSAGERLAVTGPSGAGKSSLVDVLSGTLAPTAGRVVRAPAVGRFGVQKLYQDPPAAFPARTTLGRTFRDLAALHRIGWAAITALLKRLGIGVALLDRRPNEVSGGELQRLALARVLAVRPAVILADEPTSRLDPVTQHQVMDILGDVARHADMAVVLVTHSEQIADRWAHRRLRIG